MTENSIVSLGEHRQNLRIEAAAKELVRGLSTSDRIDEVLKKSQLTERARGSVMRRVQELRGLANCAG